MSNTTQDRSDGQSIEPEISRRGIIKTAGIAAGAAAAPGAASQAGLSPVGSSRAIPGFGDQQFGPLTGVWRQLASSTGDSNSTAADAIFRDFFQDIQAQEKRAKEAIGLTFDVLERAREYWFSRAKLKAIESINLGKTESEVLADAKAPALQEIKKYQQNMVQINDDFIKTIENYFDILSNNGYTGSFVYYGNDTGNLSRNDISFDSKTFTLVDGSSQTVQTFNEDETHTLFDGFYRDNYNTYLAIHPDAEGYDYKQFILQLGDLKKFEASAFGRGSSDLNILEEINQYWDDGSSGLKYEIETWVGNAYSAVQSGDIDAAALNDAGTLFQQLSENEDTPRATASLRLLNIPSEVETTANVEVSTNDYTLSLDNVVLGSTGATNISAGDTIDPATSSSEYIANYNTTDIALDITPVSSDALDGGVLTLSKVAEGTSGASADADSIPAISKWFGPDQDRIHQVETIEGETATFAFSDLTYNSSNDNWTIDLSSQLENPIVDVESVKIFSDIDENASAYFDNSFTVTGFQSQDGSSVEQVTYDTDDREPHTTDNYLTKEEWETREAELQEQIDRIQSLDSSGGAAFGGFGGFGDLPTLPGFNALESAAIAVIAFLGLDILTS